MEAGTRAVVYRRVSTIEQGHSGLGLEAQDAAIRTYCDQRGWIIASIHHDVCSGSRKHRAGLTAALADLHRGDVLVVSKLDRLARSLSTFVRLVERAQAEGWAIAAADGSVDLTTPHGRAMAAMAAVFADLEREMIGTRTREALAAARARGVQLGRQPLALPPGIVERVKRQRNAGASLRRIAGELNAAGILAPGGGRWHAPTVNRIANRTEPS